MKHSIKLSALITFILLCFAMQGYSQDIGKVTISSSKDNNEYTDPCEKHVDVGLVGGSSIYIIRTHAQIELLRVYVVNNRTGDVVLIKEPGDVQSFIFNVDGIPRGHYTIISESEISNDIKCDRYFKLTRVKMIIHY